MISKKRPKKQVNNYALFSGIAFQMFAIISLGTFIGTKLDEHFSNQKKLFTVFLSLFSVITAIFISIKQIIRVSKKDN